jgi:predicted nucleic-acid-binding protein
MRAIDTNIIIRYLTNDDRTQAAKARAIIGHDPIFIPRTVLLEAEWVLRAVYNLPVNRIIPALRAVAGLPGVSLEDAPLAAKAMDLAEQGMDFADALHLAAAVDCESLLTFDKRFARSAAHRTGIPVTVP